MPDEGAVTLLLGEVSAGDRGAVDRLIPLVYDELRRIADRKLKGERPGHTLQPTALVHEAYVRMLGQKQPGYAHRAHFFGIAARLMRQILVDHARRSLAEKRGGLAQRTDLDAEALSVEGEDMLDLHRALSRLEEQNPQRAHLIEMRYFSGLTAEESADVTGMEVGRVRRELRVAQAWLARELAAR